jgi:signal transduction histidine kinase
MRFIAMGTVPGSIDDQPAGILLGGAVGAALVFVVTRFLSWRKVRATTAAQWIGLYFLAVVPATIAMIGVLIATGVPGAGPLGYVIVPAATWGTSMGLAWVVDQYISRLRSSTELRARLKALVAASTTFDDLLEQAEQSRFANYGDVVYQSVLLPLQALRQRADDLDDEAFARELDDLVTGTMRPLAHMLHPVSVRAGLIPALKSLGGQLEIIASHDLIEQDAAGSLIDPNVRVQVYRWARHLHSDHGSVRLVLWTTDGRLHLHGEGATRVRDLDPIQNIAGVQLIGNNHISAPLAGSPSTFEAPALAASGKIAWNLTDWRLLFTPSPVISPGVVAILCVVTAPGLSFINSVTVTPGVLTALAMAVAIPTALAFVCRRVRVPFNTTRGALAALGLWSAVGLASAAAQVLILNLFASTMMTTTLVFSLAVRGVIRLLIPGALWMAVQSLTTVNNDRAGVLQQRLSDLQDSQRRTLAEADERDREVSETLHRTVQGRLSASSLMVRLGRRSEAQMVLNEIVDQTLPDLLARLHDGTEIFNAFAPSPSATLASSSLEHFGLEVQDEVDWNAIAMMSPDVARDLRRSLAENLTNATRHGHATAATIRATLALDTVIVTCEDNGSAVNLTGPAGLGSRIHDEIVSRYEGRWMIERHNDRTVFTMTLHLLQSHVSQP